jgi:hypothetical protein
MRILRQHWAVLGVLAAIVASSAVGLWPELSIGRVDLNDNVSHYAFIERIVHTIDRGGNPLDTWSPEWTFGFPVLRVYQPLAHLLVAGLYFLFAKSVSLMTLYVCVRFLAVVLLPVSFYVTARLLELPRATALAAAVMSPLISSAGLFGLEYGSYVWAGNGLFPQSVAAHLFLLSLGFGFRSLRRGTGATLAGVLLGLTFLTHVIFGYMGALSLALLSILPDADSPRIARIVRTIRIGAVAIALSAFQLLPLILDGPTMNHSRWEPGWKWDSFGAAATLEYLFTGRMLDAGRLPVLSLAALAGFVLLIRRWPIASLAERFAGSGAVFWILLLFGRPFWGPALSLLGISPDMQLHRVAAGAQAFLILLGAVAVGEAWHKMAARQQTVLAAVLALAAIAPAVLERSAYLTNNAAWGRDNLAAYTAAAPALDATIARLKERGGRVYTGVPAGWGGAHKIGSVPFFAFLSVHQVPAVAYLYHAMALTADIQPRMNEWNPEHYRLFGIRTVVAPAGLQTALPPFWSREQTIGRFDIFRTPETGYFDIVDAPAAVHTTKHNFFDINDRWLKSDWANKHLHLLLDLGGQVPERLRIPADEPLPALPAFPAAGTIQSERGSDDSYQANCQVSRSSYVLFKMTWHANWHALVDGRPVATAMLSPGFIGVPVPAGQHAVELRYEGSIWKLWLALAGLIAIVAQKLRWRLPASVALPVWARALLPQAGIAAGVLVLALPVLSPLLTSRMPVGDDALSYLPRQIEFHQNIAHGVVQPSWAPDLDRGAGQPSFLFMPPMLHYLAEGWHALGADFQTSINLACTVLVILLAAGMFLLGRLYFGVLGGFLAAAAAVYAPYISLDLYVRSALSEFSAFAFCAFALYGFGAFASSGRRRHLVLGAVSYAAVVLSHLLVAFYFTPLLAAFLFVTAKRSKHPTMLRQQCAGFLLGIGLSACFWLPIVFESRYVQLDRAVQGNFVYAKHLLYPHQLLASTWGYGYSIPGDKDTISFGLGWGMLAIGVLAWIRSRERFWLRFFTVAAASFCLLTLDQSAFLWEWFPMLQRIQFPWRLLGPASLCLALVASALGPVLSGLGKWRWPAFAAAMAALIAPNLSHLAPRGYRDLDQHLWTPAYLATSGFETTTSGEFMPRWMQTLPPFQSQRARVVAGEGNIREQSGTPFSWSGAVKNRIASTAELSFAYFPGWEVRVDGNAVAAYPAESTGLIRFPVPPGEHSITAEWKRTPPRYLGDAISLLSVMVCILALRIWGVRVPARALETADQAVHRATAP